MLRFQAYFFYPPLLLFILSRTVSHTGWQQLAGFFVSGLILWQFIEYFLHRYVFHFHNHRSWWALMPLVHHLHHKDMHEIRLILSPIWFSFPISLIFWGFFRLLLGDWQHSFQLMAGIWTGYLWYEYVHYTAHCRQPRSWMMRYLKKYHLLHHHTHDKIWFGVTSPFIDRLFGTYREMPGIVRRLRMKRAA